MLPNATAMAEDCISTTQRSAPSLARGIPKKNRILEFTLLPKRVSVVTCGEANSPTLEGFTTSPNCCRPSRRQARRGLAPGKEVIRAHSLTYARVVTILVVRIKGYTIHRHHCSFPDPSGNVTLSCHYFGYGSVPTESYGS